MTQTDDDTDSTDQARRQFLTAAASAAGLGALGIYAAETVSAQPSGTYPQAADDPLLKIRADRIRFIPRTDDPASPDGGTRWVVE